MGKQLNEKTRAELEALKKLRLVSGSKAQHGPLSAPATIRVGVTF
jgi:hypothetical protein